MAPIRAVANDGDALLATERFWEFVLILPEGGFKREPQALQDILLDNVRSVPLTLNAPPQAITCDMVKAITVPVLITVGANTRPLWTLAGQTLQRCVPNAKLVVLVGSNHDAKVRNPAAFNRTLVDFLAIHWRTATDGCKPQSGKK